MALLDKNKQAILRNMWFNEEEKKSSSTVAQNAPTKKAQTNWYKGSQPTEVETIAQIYRLAQTDRKKADTAFGLYQKAKTEGAWYNPYSQATTSNATKTNITNTLKAKDEWARLSEELSYWANRSDRNYSDDEIIGRINWDNYKTLQKMDEGRATGTPLELLEGVGYSQDAMYGVLWAARNPGASTGDAVYDAVQRELGRGKQHNANDVNAYRDATGERYSPYKAGATALDDLAYKYGMDGDFTSEWLNGEGRALLNGDAQSREDYTRIYNIVKGTETVEAEAEAFYNKYAKPLIESGVDPAKIFYDGVFEDLGYKNLAKFVEGGKSGALYETAYAVAFDYDDLVKQANEYYANTKGSISNSDYEQQLATSTGGMYIPNEGTNKSNDSKQLNTDVLLPDYASAATEGERTSFRTTANAGYYDMVGATADFVQNGSGGEAEYKASAIAEATAYANEKIFKAWDDLEQAEAAFAATGEIDAEVSAFLEANFTDKTPTEKEVLEAFRIGKIQMPEGLLPEDQTAYVEKIVSYIAGRGQAAEAQAVIDDVLDDFAEAYGKDTEQYRSAVATYKAAYDYSRSPKNVWSAFDNYQYASQQEGVTPEMLDYYLENQRGSVAREIMQLEATIENAEKLGIPAEYVENMQKHLGDLRTQNDLLNTHNLSKNEDYSAKVAEFDNSYKAWETKWFYNPRKLTESDIIRYAVIDSEAALQLADHGDNGETIRLANSMTDEERANYKYLFMTEGEDRANEYFRMLGQNLSVRASEKSSGLMQEYAEENPVAGTIGSFGMTMLEPAAALATIASKITGEEINPYDTAFFATRSKEALRTGAKEAFHQWAGEDNKVANWAFDTFYDAITSAADSGISAAMGGKYGSILMGLSGFNASVMDASIRGASDEQAILYGISSAAIEAFTESKQVGKILDAFSIGSKAGKDALLNTLKEGFFSEAKEEMLSSFLGNISDELIMGELSNREAAIEKYMTETGLSREEAENQANKDILTDILYSGLVGGLSGAISSSASYGFGKIFGSGAEMPSTEKQTKTAPVETKEPDASDPPSGNELARAKAALNTSTQQGVSEAQQAATVAGVLQSYGMSDIEANAAAKRIVDSGNTRLLNKMLSKTANPELLMKAFAMGHVADNSACAVVLNKTINSKNIHRVTNELLEAYASDMANGRVTANYDAQVVFSAESDAIAAQVAQTGALDHTAVDNARATLKDANEQLGYARDEETAAHQAVVNANAKFNQNPADPQAKAELKSAIDKQYTAQKKRSEAENRVNAATKKLESEKQALNAKAEEFMGIAREQAKPEVQKHVEEVNTAKAEQEAAKEVQRETDNVLAMEADEFIDSHYHNATDEERQQLREQYISLNQSQETPAEPGYKGGAETDQYVSLLPEGNAGRIDGSTSREAVQGRHDGTGSSANHRGIRSGSVTSEGQLSLPSADILQSQMAAYHASRLNPTEDTVRPKSSKLGVSQFAARTGQNTSVLSDDLKQKLRKSPYYQKTSERRNVDIAINNIEVEGYEARRNKLLDGSINLFTPEGQVEAYVLAKAAKEAGDSQGESAIAFKVKESGTLLGQSLAMRRMYLEMTPEGKTQFLQRTVDKINQEYENRGKSTRVVLPEWVEARLAEADGDEELIAKVVDKAYTDIANQMPPDWKSRMNAWRYTAMLANPRTHIRNLAGNMMFMPAVAVKNKFGALAEMMFATPDERTKTLGLVRKEYKEFAKKQLEDVKDVLTGGGKHNPMSEIQSRRRDFNTPVFEWISKKNGKALEIEDAFFLNKHFVNALSGFLQARNVDVNNVDANTLQAGLDYAILEAQKATYRDASEIADKLSKFSSGLSNSKKRSARAVGLLVEGALPFKKTPVNVMRRGIEYSPVGLINTLTLGLHDMKKGEMTKADFLDGLASGLTGTGLALVGMWLYNMGNLKLKLDEPEDELEKLNGAQEYSVEIGGKSFTIDWLSPSAMPLFVGGAIAELMKADDKELNLDTIGDALLSIAEPVFNLSMLDGVNSMLSAASNSENGVVDIAMRAAESYATQFVPTVIGAFARTVDPVRRTTYTDKNSGVPKTLQYLYDSTINKIPGASYSGQPYLNAWGEEDVTENGFMRAVENFLSPGYINDLSTDDVEKGLMELFDATKDDGLIPKAPQKYFTVNKQRRDLTGEEYEQLTKERGRTAKNLHVQLFDSPEFLSLPADYQVYALEQVWEYATQTAKRSIAPEYKVDSWVAGASDPAKTILEKAQDKVKKDRSTEMKNELYGAIDSGDLATAATYVEGIMQGGTEKSSLRTSIGNQYKAKYKQMYEEGNIEGMRQLETTLLALNVGFKMATIQKWIIDSEE